MTRTAFIIIPRRVDADEVDADVDGIILRVAVIAIDRIGTARTERTERMERTMRAESTSGQRPVHAFQTLQTIYTYKCQKLSVTLAFSKTR